MPELPEVEVMRRDLDREIAGRKIKSVEVRDAAIFSRHKSSDEFVSMIEGCKIKSFDRKGLNILGKLDDSNLLVVNLGSSGHMVRVKGVKPAPSEQTKVTIHFTQGGGIRLGDARATAEVFCMPKSEFLELQEVQDMGIDLLDVPIPWTKLGAILRSHRSKLKALLVNPRVFAGIGPVYSDEILFNAGLMYDRTPDSLSAHEIRRFQRAMLETLTDAIKYRGISFDENDRDMFGARGEYTDQLKVFQRFEKACQRCRRPVGRVKFQKRYHFFCPACQS